MRSIVQKCDSSVPGQKGDSARITFVYIYIAYIVARSKEPCAAFKLHQIRVEILEQRVKILGAIEKTNFHI